MNLSLKFDVNFFIETKSIRELTSGFNNPNVL